MRFMTPRIHRLMQRAAECALNVVAGAVAGWALPVDVSKTVLKVALHRAIGFSPRWLIDAAGGERGITDRLFRAFRLDASVTEASILTRLCGISALLRQATPAPTIRTAARTQTPSAIRLRRGILNRLGSWVRSRRVSHLSKSLKLYLNPSCSLLII
ncbi:hypothetical protein MPAR168_09305 [Methylorubrum populi]|uniref:Acyl-CoA dehydrogenase/oxidase C-terminal domain-containing protein n=2 Tax=Hyphomicrobiales TaxID=356 RepID=A0ABU7TD14_9HYPH